MSTTSETPKAVPKPRLSYQRLLEILQPLPGDDQQYILAFLLSNDRKVRVKVAELENERVQCRMERLERQQRYDNGLRQQLDKAHRKIRSQAKVLTEQQRSLSSATAKIIGDHLARLLVHPETLANPKTLVILEEISSSLHHLVDAVEESKAVA